VITTGERIQHDPWGKAYTLINNGSQPSGVNYVPYFDIPNKFPITYGPPTETSTNPGIQPITFATPTYHAKGWGEELWVASNDKYCGKILRFAKGKKMSRHSHDIKSESWLVTQGKLKMTWFDLSNADEKERILVSMDVVHIPRGNPHQLEALEDSEVFEVSDADRSWDNYRIGKGDSQQETHLSPGSLGYQ
jgi:quercetin dioxygenase-like cupin family protein